MATLLVKGQIAHLPDPRPPASSTRLHNSPWLFSKKHPSPTPKVFFLTFSRSRVPAHSPSPGTSIQGVPLPWQRGVVALPMACFYLLVFFLRHHWVAQHTICEHHALHLRRLPFAVSHTLPSRRARLRLSPARSRRGLRFIDKRNVSRQSSLTVIPPYHRGSLLSFLAPTESLSTIPLLFELPLI